MMPTLLDRLTDDEFHLSLGFMHTPAAIRRALLRSPDVKRLAAAIRYGLIHEDVIGRFVGSVTGPFEKGRRLPDDLALAALAVVLERRPTAFAEEFLHDLSRLDLTEMRLSIGVARECLANRYSLPKHQARSDVFPRATQSAPARPCAVMPRGWGLVRTPRTAARYGRHLELA